MLNMKHVEPVRLSLNTRFKFKCYKGIGCFTKCCSNIDIMLTPYDIVRLKTRMGISSGEFLNNYTYIHIDEKATHPFVFLKMNEDAGRECPFVTADGCTIYMDRPANCRYYPVGQASLKKADEKTNETVTEEFYFFVKEEHCLGFKEDSEWTIKSWRDDQGVDIYDDMNRGWKEILFRRNLPGHELDEKKQKAFYMACYDVDRFRRFVFETKFLEAFDVDGKRVEKMKADDTEMMKFGFDYTKFILMMEETLKKKA
ncbi:MAG: YkgJ family cysteine cluster protein [Nitrospirae bacterium]|nr:YkgJ family cysteine cluster protein [Nitrospirota bacterium]MCL5237255.1 YkgJ family cysteine cluster protein [Nitrospirota bacterium]